MSERRQYPGEVRAEGRRIVGVAMPYGALSPTHRERFEPGAFGSLDDGATRWLDIRHNYLQVIAHAPGGGLTFHDSAEALEIRAELPEIPGADVALRGVKSGALGGLSVEFDPLQERREGDTRIIERARLRGVGLVPHPSYEGARAEVRQRSGFTMRQRIPADAKIGCRCSGAACDFARITGEAMQQAFNQAWNEAAEILAVRSNYGTPLASKSTGSLRARVLDNGDAEVEVDLPAGPDGEAVLRDIENTGAVLIRPHFDKGKSKGREERAEGGLTMVYERAVVRSLVVGATDAVEGWPKPALDTGERGALALPESDTPQARPRIWL